MQELLGRTPVLGVCLGHQLIAVATGKETFKLPFGHRGANHPVVEHASRRVVVTSQNHGFAVAPGDENGVTHSSLYDGTVEGLAYPELRARRRSSTRSVTGTARRRGARRLRRRVEGGLMPRREDIHSICLIGSGPIVIGQAAEFDYAGCQALKVLREDGFRTIVVNSNPATIMTDPGFADRTYLEPLDLEGVAGVLRRERPDALLPTMGGGTALNVARELHGAGVLRELGIELIGADMDSINRAEDRELFKATVESCGLKVPTSRIVTTLDDLEGVSLPAVVRPAFTLGGHGGGFADTPEQLHAQVERGLSESPISQVLVEESVRGWDEFELEVVRDKADNVVIVCSIENLDPMGVHTGDSITVAPQMTLSDEAYQELRDAAIAVIRAVGVDTGGSNIQFARDRETGELRVIEMNPRVSRSSALASKATGYPIAKVAAKLAVGYTLDEVPNDLTRTTPASFEPTLDYVVVKIPRFAFEKFPGADRTLGTQMKSVGETMGIGRSFIEAFVKAKRGLEGALEWEPDNLHPWFARELEAVAAEEERQTSERPVYRRIDSCAGEVEASSNYYYATWGERDEARPEATRSGS